MLFLLHLPSPLSPLNIETILLQISSLWRSRLSIVQSYSKYDLTFANYLFTLYILIQIYSYRFIEYIYILRADTLFWTINANFATDWSLLFFLASWSQKHDSTYHITQRFTTIAQLITQITKEEKKSGVFIARVQYFIDDYNNVLLNSS